MSIISLSLVRNTWNVTDIMPSFSDITNYVILLSVIEGIFHGKYYLRDDVFKNDTLVYWDIYTVWF